MAHGDWLVVFVLKWLGGAGNLLSNYGTVSQDLDWCVGSKMAWRDR